MNELRLVRGANACFARGQPRAGGFGDALFGEESVRRRSRSREREETVRVRVTVAFRWFESLSGDKQIKNTIRMDGGRGRNLERTRCRCACGTS